MGSLLAGVCYLSGVSPEASQRFLERLEVSRDLFFKLERAGAVFLRHQVQVGHRLIGLTLASSRRQRSAHTHAQQARIED